MVCDLNFVKNLQRTSPECRSEASLLFETHYSDLLKNFKTLPAPKVLTATYELLCKEQPSELRNLLALCLYKLEPDSLPHPNDIYELLNLCFLLYKTDDCTKAQSTMLNHYTEDVLFTILSRDEVSAKGLARVGDVLALRQRHHRLYLRDAMKRLYTGHLTSQTVKSGFTTAQVALILKSFRVLKVHSTEILELIEQHLLTPVQAKECDRIRRVIDKIAL